MHHSKCNAETSLVPVSVGVPSHDFTAEDSDEPTLDTDRSALIAQEMYEGATVRSRRARRAHRPFSGSLRTGNLLTVAVSAILGGLLAVFFFSPLGSDSSANAATPLKIKFVDLPSDVTLELSENFVLSLEDRARTGESQALDTLRALGLEMNSEQVLAVQAGEIAREEMDLRADSLLQAAEGVRPRIAELLALTRLPGAVAADALHEIWARSLQPKAPKVTVTQQLARRLLQAPDIRGRASPSLKAALSLYEANDCESAREAMLDAERYGDERSAHGVQQVAGGSACEEDDGECQRCVKHRSLTHRAFLAVRNRPACPAFRCDGPEPSEHESKSFDGSSPFALATKGIHD